MAQADKTSDAQTKTAIARAVGIVTAQFRQELDLQEEKQRRVVSELQTAVAQLQAQIAAMNVKTERTAGTQMPPPPMPLPPPPPPQPDIVAVLAAGERWRDEERARKAEYWRQYMENVKEREDRRRAEFFAKYGHRPWEREDSSTTDDDVASEATGDDVASEATEDDAADDSDADDGW
jgi:hypothetical protein